MLTRETLEFCMQRLIKDLGWSLEDQNPDGKADCKGHVHEISVGTALEVKLEVIHFAFSQRTCLHFAHVLGLSMRLSLKVAD